MKKEQTKGVIALIIVSALSAVMGIWVRYLGDYLEVYQQVAARAGAGLLIGIFLYWKYFRINKLISMPIKDLLLLILRTSSFVIGVGLYSLAIMNTTMANVGFIFALPTTALFGIILLKEKITKNKILLLLLGFVGTIFVAIDINNIQDISFGKGELLAFFATFFYSFSYIVRKWLSPHLNNQEITQAGSFFAFLISTILFLSFGHVTNEFAHPSPLLMIVILLAGLTVTSLNYFLNYGFEKVEAITANNILILGAVFGLIIGFLFYQEIPTIYEFIGGGIIIVSAYGMNRISS